MSYDYLTLQYGTLPLLTLSFCTSVIVNWTKAILATRQFQFPVSVEAKLSFVEPGHRWAHSPSCSKAPGVSYQGTMKTSVRILKTSGGHWLLYGASFYFRRRFRWAPEGFLVCFTWLWASWGVPPGDSSLFVQLLPPVLTSVPAHDSPLWAPWAAVAFFCFLRRFPWVPESFFFFEPWLVRLSAPELSSCRRVHTRGPSSECSLFHFSPSPVIRWGHRGWGCLV